MKNERKTAALRPHARGGRRGAGRGPAKGPDKGPDRRCEWGRRGEEIAARYLRSSRWQLLDRNVYYRCGELDIVAIDEGVLVFVEVRSRWGTSGPRPEDTVRFGKQRRLSRAALRYTRVKGLVSLRSRFDVIAVDLRAGRVKAHHRGCFEAVGIG